MTGWNAIEESRSILGTTILRDGTKVWVTRHRQQFMNKARGKRRDGTKGKYRVFNKKGKL